MRCLPKSFIIIMIIFVVPSWIKILKLVHDIFCNLCKTLVWRQNNRHLWFTTVPNVAFTVSRFIKEYLPKKKIHNKIKVKISSPLILCICIICETNNLFHLIRSIPIFLVIFSRSWLFPWKQLSWCIRNRPTEKAVYCS